MKDNGLIDWLKLARTEGIGPITFFGLIQKYKSAKEALKAIPQIKAKNGNLKYKIPPVEVIEQEIENTIKFGGEIIKANDAAFPKALANISPPPPVISIIGNKSLLNKPTIGIVGSRNASMSGIKIARQIAFDLSNSGFVIVSGLARGIDGAAHIASLNGGTIAVLAGGIDYIYPPEHLELYEKIKECGIIVSENPFGAKVFARDFPRRNRIISGLSKGVIIVEAEEKSGSLITARYALEQNREVMAIPGSPFDPRAGGTNNLIKHGAALITSAQDVIDIFQSQRDLFKENDYEYEQKIQDFEFDADLINMVYSLISPTPISIEEICSHTGLPWRSVAVIILELELEGKVFSKSSNMVSSIE